MKWINVNEKYLDYLRAFEGRIPRTDYGSDKYKPFFCILFETEDFYYITLHRCLMHNPDIKK